MSMFPIASQTVSGSSTNAITFSNIPQNFTHIQIRAFWNNTASVSGDYQLAMAFNGDGYPGTNYSWHIMNSYGTALGAYGATGQWNCYLGNLGGVSGSGSANYVTPTSTATTFAFSLSDIFDYSNPNKNKTVKTLSGVDYNGGGNIMLSSSAKETSTSAITSIIFQTAGSGGNFLAGSRIDLYGLTVA